jgi:hypothetical protein
MASQSRRAVDCPQDGPNPNGTDLTDIPYTPVDFPIGGFSPPEGRLACGFKPPAFSRFLFQSAVKSAESF